MTTAQIIFLYVAEEKNITRAAERAFVTQQCASRHIANLEQQYGVPLIVRRPVFSLTEAGETLAASLKRMFVLEKETEECIAEISRGASGHITIGMNMARAGVLLPEMLIKYREKCPEVRITVRSGDTEYLAELLKKGEIDLMIGVNLAYDPQFEVLPLVEDRIFFVANERSLKAQTEDDMQKKREAAEEVRKGKAGKRKVPAELSLERISRLPLCRNLPGSTLTELLDRFAAAQNIQLGGNYFFSDYRLQTEFCGRGLAGAFFPESVLNYVHEWNASHASEERIEIFRIPELKETLHIDLIRNREGVRPGYMRVFVNTLKETAEMG